MSKHTRADVPGAVGSRPGNKHYRTGADVLGDVVSLAILAALALFAIAVSFTHTTDFVRMHGQTRGWVVVGTACTVVLLTLQSAMEVWRDQRAGRRPGWPVVIFAGGVLVELTANASTATGGTVNAFVAAWPVPVAATAVWLATRRLQHAAEAAEQRAATIPAPADMWPNPPQPWRPRPDDDQDVDQDQAEHDDQVHDDQADDASQKERVYALLDQAGAILPTPADVAKATGVDRRYAWRLIKEYSAAADDQTPGQLDGLDAIREATAA